MGFAARVASVQFASLGRLERIEHLRYESERRDEADDAWYEQGRSASMREGRKKIRG